MQKYKRSRSASSWKPRRLIEPPDTEYELTLRGRELVGRTLGEIAFALGLSIDTLVDAKYTKGKQGELIEWALGASGKNQSVLDFPALQVELKTVPLNSKELPKESTFVCRVNLEEASDIEWEKAWVRQKLSRVLWVGIDATERHLSLRKIRFAHLWSPSPDEEKKLRCDFELLMGLIAIGKIEDVNARLGEVMQMRPKAKDSNERTLFHEEDGNPHLTGPKGFYLRTSFTKGIVREAFVSSKIS